MKFLNKLKQFFQSSKLKIATNTHENNSWFSYRESSDTVIVFVHGLMSSAGTCWLSKTGVFWPEIVRDDIEFANANIFLAGYHTSLTSERYNIAQCAHELVAALKMIQAEKRAPIAHANILFVAHSLGGIVCRRVLEQNVLDFCDHRIGLVLMASPSLGSDYARTFSKAAKVYDHKIAEELLPESDALCDIDDRFRQLLQAGRFRSLVGAEAVEHKGPMGIPFLPAMFSPVVKARSGSRYFGAERIIPDTDHFSIVKPEGPNSPSHSFLVQFCQAHFKIKMESSKADSVAENNSQPRIPDPLFEIYSKEHEKYYIARDIDVEVAQKLRYANVWLSGVSGAGKTSIARRYLALNSHKPVEISLAHLLNSRERSDLFEEIRQTLAALKPLNQGSESVLDKIASLCETEVVPLFLDEFPINIDSTSLIEAIGAISDHLKRRGHLSARLIVCSISAPDMESLSGRMKEQFSFIDVGRWSEFDIALLLNSIARDEQTERLSGDSQTALLISANGSPRFIKTYLRIFNAKSISGIPIDPQMVLAETQQALR